MFLSRKILKLILGKMIVVFGAIGILVKKEMTIQVIEYRREALGDGAISEVPAMQAWRPDIVPSIRDKGWERLYVL